MAIIVRIPDDIATHMTEAGGDLGRRALESLALGEYKAGHITEPELRRVLGFETRHQLDGFLNSHDVYDGYTVQDVEQQVATLERLGY